MSGTARRGHMGLIVFDPGGLIRYIPNHRLIHLHIKGHYNNEFALGCRQRDIE